MINSKSVIAIVPARSGSKGLPGKNVRIFCGKPLLAWSVEQALQSKYVDNVLVTTDSRDIAEIAVKFGASAPFLRPQHLADDNTSSFDVIMHALDYEATCGRIYDYVLLIEPTSPLRDISDIDGCLERLDSDQVAQSVVGVSKAEGGHPAFLFRVDENLLHPSTGVYPNALRRQDLEQKYYFLEGSIYASSVSALREHGGFYHDRTAPWIVERYKSIEIDELCDFIAAEALFNAKLQGHLS